jgi:FkbM family methyltransferase
VPVRPRAFVRWVVPVAVWESASRFKQVASMTDRRLARRLAFRDRPWNALLYSRLDLLPKDQLSQLRVVVDGGANVGDWTSAVLDVIRPDVVHAFEPFPELAACLEDRFQDVSGVIVHAAALGRAAGRSTLNVTRHSHNASLRSPTEEAQRLLGSDADIVEKIDVPVVALSEVIAEPIDLLKLDLQGYELEAIAGAGQALATTSWVLIEVSLRSLYEGEASFVELDRALVDHGFRLMNLSRPFEWNGRATFVDALYGKD